MGAVTQTSGYRIYLYQHEKILLKKHLPITDLKKNDIVILTKMRQYDHENVNKFVGLCLDAPSGSYSVWKYNSRNSLMDNIIRKPTLGDSFFKFCLIRDLLNGLHALHHSSFLKYHGQLTSACCLISERYQIRISDYCLAQIGIEKEKSKLDQLWTAPELLRSEEKGSKEGDIYSFAVICSEITTGQTAWNDLRNESDAEEILYHVKRGRTPLERPSLGSDAEVISPVIGHLIRDCWAENPEDRPSTDAIKTLMRSINLSKKKNLMDHMLCQLEEYASNLEQEVEEKTKEAVEEKKRADLLLYKILPRHIAERLKAGESVEPESYEEVTIFFSDVVSFTTIAGKCSPLQVVTLLNDLYTLFDSIIDEHDVFKVETIGDAYLCASGLPQRNGHEHGREIANMALKVVQRIGNLKDPHEPNESINVRVGIHTGPCVAGVVGLAMPRYCVFGDTINTASRMESNGKPGRIHLSPEANWHLTKIIGGFRTESRGEIMVKGKGVMETFWLLDDIGYSEPVVQ